MKFLVKLALGLCIVLLCLASAGVFAQTANITNVTSPTNANLNSVFMVNNITNTGNDLTKLDAWAVGDGGAIIRWNGASWSVVNSATTANLNSVFFVNSSYGWAVGGNSTSGVILNYNGTWRNWQAIALNTTSTPNATVSAPLYAINGDINGTVGWAVGANGTIFGWNATTCFMVPSGTNATLRGVGMIHGSNEAWAVGDNGTILHFSNQTSTWSMMTSPTNATLYTITMINATSGWAAGGSGTNGTVLNLDGTTWSVYNKFNFGANGTIVPTVNATIYSISAGNNTSAWGVGSNGTVMYFNGTSWSCNANVANVNLKGVSMIHGTAGLNQAWTVGDSGRILAFTGQNWIPEIPIMAIPLLLGIGVLMAFLGKARLLRKHVFLR